MSTKAFLVRIVPQGWVNMLYPLFLPGQKVPSAEPFTSRGRSRKCGSGPYYRLRGTPHWREAGSSSDMVQDYYRQDGKYKYWYTFEPGEDPTSVTFYSYCQYQSKYYDILQWRQRDVWYVEDSGDPQHPYHVRKHEYRNNSWDENRWSDYGITEYGNGSGSDVELYSDIPKPMPYYDDFLMFVEAGYIPPQMQQHFSNAYMSAASALPEAEVNLAANLKETLDYIKGAIGILKDPKHRLSEIFQSFAKPKDLWLSYRYVYKTNQQDAKEMEELISSLDFMASHLNDTFFVEGSDTFNGVRYGVTMSFPISSIFPKDVISYLKMFGLNVTPSNVWDLVPFSFMVDWFAGIGDKLSFLENWASCAELTPNDIWYTVRASGTWGDVYYRIPGHIPVIPPVYESRQASDKVVLMRFADTVSIFT